MRQQLRNWLNSNWYFLIQGEKIPIPFELHHLVFVVFEKISLAEDVGQIADYALSVHDGSRLHIHEFPSGELMIHRLVIHRDEFNPQKDILHAMRHLVFETKYGPIALGIGAGIITGIIVEKAINEYL